MEEAIGEKKRVCVTGAGGFIASWLVKLLLSKGYIVHGTVRQPSDEKNAHLKTLENASENLILFKADLLDYDSVVSAISTCEGVFHLASPVPSTKVSNPEVALLSPAVTGTLNVLKACSEAKVERVVIASSVVAVTMNPNWPKGKIMDEECWSDSEHCRTTENWYCVSKTLAESEALEYADKHGLDLVTVLPCMVIGPMLQSTMNASSLFLINLLKGAKECVDNSLRRLVDVRDVADALLLVYEKPEGSGRYICVSHSIRLRDMVDMLKSWYPNYKYPKNFTEVDGTAVSSRKLQMLGWKCKPLEESFKDSIESYQAAGLLNED